MLTEMMDKLKQMGVKKVSVDPSRFNDPVAMQTSWTPLVYGGASFKTHRLREPEAGRIEITATIGAKVFYLLFLILGIGLVIGAPAAGYFSDQVEFSLKLLLPVFIGLVFAGVGGALLVSGTTPAVIDRRSGLFWKGRKQPHPPFDSVREGTMAQLNQVYALQIIEEYVNGNKSSYHSYELNLVLSDGSRVNVADHGHLKSIQEKGAVISKFLGKPLWDATAIH